MKKNKLLSTLIVMPTLGATLLPLVSCGGGGSKPTSTHIITFNAGEHGTITTNTVEVKDGTAWSDVNKPTPTTTGDWRFVKWVDSNGNDIEATFKITTNLTVKAIYQSTVMHTTTFRCGENGSFNGSQEISYQESEGTIWKDAKKPTCVPDSGYEFDNWYCNDEVIPETFSITKDMEIVAKFKSKPVKDVKITIDPTSSGTHTLTEYNTKSNISWGEIKQHIKFPTPNNADKMFKGWYINGVEPKDSDVFESNITITAQYVDVTPLDALEYTINERKEIFINGFKNTSYPVLAIPEKYNNYPLVIDGQGFKNNTTLKEVYVVETRLIVEGSNARQTGFDFTGCSNLEKAVVCVKAHSTYERCWDCYAPTFSGCTSLKNVYTESFIHTSTQQIFNCYPTIKSDTFKDCTSLESFTIDNSICGVDLKAFNGCSNLKNVYFGKEAYGLSTSSPSSGLTSLAKIKVNPENTHSTSRNSNDEECNYLVDKNTKTLLWGCKNTKVSNDATITKFGKEAFIDATGLKEILFPLYFQSAEEDTFTNCKISKITTYVESDNWIEFGLYNDDVAIGGIAYGPTQSSLDRLKLGIKHSDKWTFQIINK